MVTTREAVMLPRTKPDEEDPSAVWNYRAPLWCPACDVGASYERCWICGGEMVAQEWRLMSVKRNGTNAMRWAPDEVEP